MSGWTDVWLGVIALATLAIAVAQIAVMVVAGRAFKRMAEVVDRLERDVKPIIGHVNQIGQEAVRATSLAAAQVERVDRVFDDLATRIELTLASVQESMGVPAREARAVLAGLRAAIQTLGDVRRNPRGRAGRGEDEEALFI